MEITATIPASIPNVDPAREEIQPIVPTRSEDNRGRTERKPAHETNSESERRIPLTGEDEPAFELPTPRSVRLQLHIDDDTGEVYGSFVDRETGAEIRQLPFKEIRHLSAQIKEMLGNLVDESA